MKYTLIAGRYNRLEAGQVVKYKLGDTIDLNPDEAKRLAAIVKPAIVPPSVTTHTAVFRRAIPAKPIVQEEPDDEDGGSL